MEKPSVKICVKSLNYEELEKILRDMVCKSSIELCNELKYEKKKNPSSDVLMRPKILISIQRPDNSDVVDATMDERKHSGRKMKNHVLGEKVVRFKLPDDFDGESIQDIDKIKERLGKWRLQRRQRDSNMKETFYCHLSSKKTFRTIPEVLNFIMFGCQSKSTQKRSASDDLASPNSKAIITTEGMEQLMIVEPSNKQNQTLEKNFGPAEKIASLEEAVQQLDDDDESDHFKQN